MQEFVYSEGQSGLESASLELSYTYAYLKGLYRKRMLFRFKSTYPVCLTKLTLALIPHI